MRTLTIRNLRANPVRFLATMLAVILATGFLATAIVLRDSVAATLEANTSGGLGGVDVAVWPDLEAAELNLTQAPRVPPTVLAMVRSTDGVTQADGTLAGPLALLDGPRERAVGHRALEPGPLDPFVVVDGRAPDAPGEIAVDAQTGREIATRTGGDPDTEGAGVGRTVTLATAVGERPATVTGIVRFGSSPRREGQPTIVVTPADATDWLRGGIEGFDAVLATTVEGSDPATVAGRIERELPREQAAALVVGTGEDFRAEQAGGAAEIANAIGIALQVFAYVALFVGIFIIYNTFTIVVAQRQRELALLRAVGASTAQLRRAVLTEAFVVGLAASALGYLAGVVLVGVLGTLLPGLLSLGASDEVALSLGPIGIVQVVVSGLVVTLISALVPAVRAARISPLEAMRAGSAEDPAPSRGRILAGAVFGVIGVATMLGAVGTGQAWMLAPGPALLFLAALLLGPVLITAFGGVVGALGARSPGGSLGFSAQNLTRSPRRAATTANALVIGMFLVVFTTAAGGAIRDWAVTQVESFGGADLLVGTEGPALDPVLVERIEAADGVEATAPVYFGVGYAEPLVAGEPTPLFLTGTRLPDAADPLGIEVTAGSLDDLGSHGIALVDLVGFGGPALGDEVSVVLADGSRRPMTVEALLSLNLFALAVVDDSVVFEVDPDALPATLAVQVGAGRAERVQDEIETLIAPYSAVEVLPGNFLAGFLRTFFDAIISGINGLLAIAVVIAVFGIANTLVLATIERTREIGLLRAVGMTRAQVRATIRTEAFLLGAFGTVIGMLCGLFVAVTVTLTLLTDSDSAFSWPVTELLVIAILGMAIGLVASVVPARRASRIPVLEAIASE